ncbi:hypothetical protein CHS0354_016152 [Potamilus streckersoni]|uniref:Uncharacterized protein n=1 Tax=Potamilus streckersoni TaxID=2493646 RepID=A0AAE0SR17_9BIVA|nr:hypothetical protein CHS0354_016152 [Potamilus streckersoni]
MAWEVTLVGVCTFLLVYYVQTTDISNCTYDGALMNCSFYSFREIPNITSLTVPALDISNNKISTITLLDFREAVIDNLKSLNLSHNQISTIYNSSFQKLKNLEVLDLSNNLLHGEDLNTKVFDELEHLKVLNLERNPLKFVRRKTFDYTNLEALEHLDLSHCDIQNLEDSSIDLPRLVDLDLSWNRLQSLKPDALRMMADLEILDLSHNDLTEIRSLFYLPELKTLILDNNGLRHVELSDAVDKFVSKVRVISLRNNEITTLGQDDLPWDLEMIDQIDFTNNPIKCDCKLKWIISSEIIVKKNVTIQCMYPEEVRGANLLKLSDDKLICRTPVLEIMLAIGASVMAVAIIIVVVFCIIALRRRRIRIKKSKDGGGDYTAMYTRDDEDENHRVSISEYTIFTKDGGGKSKG